MTLSPDEIKAVNALRRSVHAAPIKRILDRLVLDQRARYENTAPANESERVTLLADQLAVHILFAQVL